MSASLPRIKTMSQFPPQPQLQGLQKLKFRKLALQPSQNSQERKKSVRVLKTERLKSLERYTTSQQQREYKNQKIHLNLIERKLLAGTYDEKKETGSELNSLKQKRDSIKVETALKQREIERFKNLLDEVRKEIEQFLSKKGEHDLRLGQIRDRHDLQIEKTEAARECRAVFETMVKMRQDINMVLCKRTNELKQQLTFAASALSLVDTELREATEKCAAQEAKSQHIAQNAAKEREQRDLQVSKHQQKIGKRKEGQILQAEKSRQYIAFLDQTEREAGSKDFKAVYNKVLANLFVSRHFKKAVRDLREKYQPYERSYELVASYKSFDAQNPQTLVSRYFQQQPQNARNIKTIAQKEIYLNALQAKNQSLKKIQLEIISQSMQFSLNMQSLKGQNQNERITNQRESAKQAEQKATRVKSALLRMLQELKQKGDRRSSNGNQAAANNLNLISKVVLQLIHQ